MVCDQYRDKRSEDDALRAEGGIRLINSCRERERREGGKKTLGKAYVLFCSGLVMA